MKIENLRIDHYNIALPTPLSDATHGTMTHFVLITVRVQDNAGGEGLGYAITGGKGGAALHALLKDDIAPRLIGEDPRRIEQLWQKMWWELHPIARAGLAIKAFAAVDIALWDGNAARQGEPLWRVLGGHNPRVRAYAGGIDLQFTLADLLRQTDDNLERGFRAIKMKVGRQNLSEDVARVAAMRKHLGDGFPLMVDVNCGWSVDQAIRGARAFQEFDLTWLEEPTIPDDLAGNLRIAEQGGVPLASGENLRNLYEFKELIASGAAAFPEPDVVNVGGITPFMKVARVAEAFNLPVTSHGAHDVTVHLLAAIPNASYLEAHGYGLDRFIEQPLRIVDGEAIAPDAPGHGIRFIWEKLAPFAVTNG